MTYALNTVESSVRKNSIYSVSAILMVIFFHQSNILFDVNISLADIFCFLILICLVSTNKLHFPIIPTIFFIITSILVLFTSFFYIPNKYAYTPVSSDIMISYIKIIVTFVYFLIGYNLTNEHLMEKLLKWYSLSALFIAMISMSFTLLNITLLSDVLYYGGVRLRGFMNDPNYFAVLQITAMVYFSRTKKLGIPFKFAAILILLISVVFSGSKTGLITIGCYVAFRLLENLFRLKIKLKPLFYSIIFTTLMGLLFLILKNPIQGMLDNISSTIPAFFRIQLLLTDPVSAISEGGSGRNITWATAIEMIKLSPILGIGVGTFSAIGLKYWGIESIAHNTYLQLTAEWGILLAGIFYLYVLYVIVKSVVTQKSSTEASVIIRDILIIILIGSLAVSFNNARMFWLFLGMFVLSMNKKTNKPNKLS